jgi:hypothetical protein
MGELRCILKERGVLASVREGSGLEAICLLGGDFESFCLVL